MTEKHLSRRSFVAGSIGAAGIVALGSMIGCSSPPAAETPGDTASKPVEIEVANTDIVFDIEKGTVTLNSGIEMPLIGIGTYTLAPAQAEESVYNALLDGYHLVDTANAYMNERAVGRAIKKSNVPREEIFVSTKLWPSEYDNAAKAIDETLARLVLDYIDLLFPHQATDNYMGAYQAMEQAVRDGKVRTIGLSNFYEETFDEIMGAATIAPAVLQNERNPYIQQVEMREHIKPYSTVLMDWFPLGGRGGTRQQSLFNDATILEIAQAYGKTAVQVILRWHLQSGGIAMPGSSNPDHILENISLFDFELTDGEMQRMGDLDTGALSFDFRNMGGGGFGSFTAPMDFNAQE
jgi:diketogulonate reductase-like aldo/keto reductase